MDAVVPGPVGAFHNDNINGLGIPNVPNGRRAGHNDPGFIVPKRWRAHDVTRVSESQSRPANDGRL